MAGDLLRLDRLLVPPALAAVGRVVGVEDYAPAPREGGAHPVAVPVLRGEVAHHDEGGALPVPAQEGHRVGGVVVGAQPLEALPGVVLLPQGGVLQIEGVHGLDKVLSLAVGSVLQQVPVQRVLKVPLVPLAQLRPHKGELLARVGHHIGVEGPDTGEFLGVVPGHLAEEGALHVDHLVVGQGQDIVLREGVHQGEGDVPVVELAEVGVQLDIVADVIHPAHVPLEVKAQTAVVHRLGHLGPGGGLLGHHEHVGVGGEDGGVQVLEELDGLQVLVAAVDVGQPLALLPVVVQVEHGGHRVHPQAVHVVLLQPEHGRGEEEGAHLRPAEVEHVGAPLLMLPLPGVGVLVGGGAVEVVQAEGVPREVGGDPVHDDPDARLVELVDKVFQVVRSAETAGGGEVAGTLVAPGGVQGVLGDGEQLHVGKAHLLHVGHQIAGDVPVAEELALAGAPPGAQVALVDVHGPAVGRVLGPESEPVPVAPLIARVKIIDFAGHVGPGGGMEAVGVAFAHEAAAIRLMYSVLVGVVAVQAGDEDLPDTPLYLGQRGGLQIPVVEVADEGDLGGVGGPDPEEIALGAVFIPGGMGTEAPPGVGGAAFCKGLKLQIKVVWGEFFLIFGHNYHLVVSFADFYQRKLTRGRRKQRGIFIKIIQHLKEPVK